MPYTKVGPWVNGGAPALSAANLDTLETQYDEAKVTVAETEVYNAAAPVAWTDLDLSAVVGSNTAVVVLKIINNTAAGRSLAVRKNGDGDEFFLAGVTRPYGAASYDSDAGIHVVFIVATDGAGKIEWQCEFADAVVIDIIAYWKGD